MASSPILGKIEGVLFDMDGTVMNSHPVWDTVLNEMCVKYRGTPMTQFEADNQLGWSMEEVADNLFPDIGLEEYYTTLEEGFIRYADSAKVLDGAKEMVSAAVRATGGKIALVTNCPLFLSRHLITRNPFLKESFGDAIFCAFDKLPEGDELPQNVAAIVKAEAEKATKSRTYDPTQIASKPSPVMLMLAAHYLGVDVTRCLMIGDAINDIKAGNNAGCGTIAINWLEGQTQPLAAFNTKSLPEVTAIIEERFTTSPNYLIP